jgi:murein L,D-transpeptidase YcbB/YkuD
MLGLGRQKRIVSGLNATLLAVGLLTSPVAANVTAFKQAIAETTVKTDAVAAFYRQQNYAPLWTGSSDLHLARRAALLRALSSSDLHGLPSSRYRPDAVKALMADATNNRARGRVEVELTKVFLQFARDVQSGIVVPSTIDSGIVRKIEYTDPTDLLNELVASEPRAFMASLAPSTPEYKRLMKEKMLIEQRIAQGGWGAIVPAKVLKPGESGDAVVALRNRLTAMGYLGRSATRTYDAAIQSAVQTFQSDHGLTADGVAGEATLKEINQPAQKRLQSIIVAMERERWLNKPRGQRHVLVNLTDFHARIIDDGKVTFMTRSVVGKNVSDRRTPEFSDVMEHMVINPTWHVPRSIATKEYLPMLQQNPNAVSHLRLIDSRGQTLNRSAVDFTQFSARSFPFAIKQPPSRSNALGLVKFMFPNKHNIYLHDTPAKNLFSREVRAYSHGCIRLQDPFDFAYALLAKQTDDPKGFFQSRLRTGSETQVNLEQHVPVHLIYRTAITTPKGNMQYRRDIYGRDAKIWNALADAGVVLADVKS